MIRVSKYETFKNVTFFKKALLFLIEKLTSVKKKLNNWRFFFSKFKVALNVNVFSRNYNEFDLANRTVQRCSSRAHFEVLSLES